MTYQKNSPYYKTPKTSWYLGHYVHRSITPHSSDTFIELPKAYEFKPYFLADEIYNDSRLWWVFAVRNMDVIFDPIYDFKAGIQIAIPSKIRIQTLLGS